MYGMFFISQITSKSCSDSGSMQSIWREVLMKALDDIASTAEVPLLFTNTQG